MAVEQAGAVAERSIPPVRSLRASESPEQLAARETAEREAAKQAHLARFRMHVGGRYQDCAFANFTATLPAQAAAVSQLRAYVDGFPEHLRLGRGLMLYGPTGTGKDHLLCATAVEVIERYVGLIYFTSGAELCGEMRTGIKRGLCENEMIEPYRKAKVLFISDLGGISGDLGDYQASMLYRIIDYRYRNLLPTWSTMNASGMSELASRVTMPVADRLRDGALCIECNWPSYRKAMKP